MDRKVAKRYAAALYRTAASAGVIEAVESDLNAIQTVLDGSPKVKTFIFTPQVGREEKIAIIEKLFSDRVTALSMQTLRLLLAKRRESEFEGVREEFILLRRQHGQVLFAKVTSATELDSAQKALIEGKLAEKSGKRVEAEYFIDPTVMGGAKVQFGNHVVDGTVRGSLNRLRDTLKYQLLKQN